MRSRSANRVSRRFLEASRSFCALTGYSREELIGRTATEVGLIADDAQRALVSANADRGRAGPPEIEIRCKDGTVRALEISIQLMADDEVVLTVSRDVTDREQSGRELAADEARLRSAAESTRDGIAIISPVRDEAGDLVDFQFAYVNDAYFRLVRPAREHLLGRRLGEVFTGFTSSDRFAACREVLLTGAPSRDESVASADTANVPMGPRTILDARSPRWVRSS
ncbi:MAG: PAS domain-containing protein [Solirubrobacteraceae bacterium]